MDEETVDWLWPCLGFAWELVLGAEHKKANYQWGSNIEVDPCDNVECDQK